MLNNRIQNVGVGVRVWWYKRIDPAGLNECNLIQHNVIGNTTGAAISLGKNCFRNRVLQNSIAGRITAVESENEIAKNTTP